MANVIRLDKVKGYPVSFKNSIENLAQGLFLELKGLSNGDYEAYEVELAKGTPTNTVVFHASVVVQYDERLMEQDFVLANLRSSSRLSWESSYLLLSVFF